MTGRRTKLTPELTEEFAGHIRDGKTIRHAALVSDVGERTVHRWLAEGEQQEGGAERQFWQAVTRAREDYKHELLKKVEQGVLQNGKSEDWRAQSFILERRFAEDFGQTVMVRQKVEGELSQMLDRLQQNLDEDTYARVLAILSGDIGEEAAREAAGGTVH